MTTELDTLVSEFLHAKADVQGQEVADAVVIEWNGTHTEAHMRLPCADLQPGRRFKVRIKTLRAMTKDLQQFTSR